MNIWEKLGLLIISIIGFIGIFFLIKYLIKINKNQAPNIVNNEPNIANDNINYNSIFGDSDLDNLIIDLAPIDFDFIELINSLHLQNSFTTSDNKNYQLKIPLITQHFFDKNEKLKEFINLIIEFFHEITNSDDLVETISELQQKEIINILHEVTDEEGTTIRTIQFKENPNYFFNFFYNEHKGYIPNVSIYDQNSQRGMLHIAPQQSQIIYLPNETMTINVQYISHLDQLSINIDDTNDNRISINLHGTNSNKFILNINNQEIHMPITEKNDEQLKNIVLLLQNIFNINEPTDIEDQ